MCTAQYRHLDVWLIVLTEDRIEDPRYRIWDLINHTGDLRYRSGYHSVAHIDFNNELMPWEVEVGEEVGYIFTSSDFY